MEPPRSGRFGAVKTHERGCWKAGLGYKQFLGRRRRVEKWGWCPDGLGDKGAVVRNHLRGCQSLPGRRNAGS